LTDDGFWADMRRRFDGGTVKLHLAPPVLGGRDPATGRPRKRVFSARRWLPLLRLMARGKALRGTAFDPFGWMRERRMEREIRDEYLETMRTVASELRSDNYDAALQLAAYPEGIRGYGSVKEQSIEATRVKAEDLRKQFSVATTALSKVA
jgi:indolepyruvate ferredoxin oxidoreductase